MHDPDAAGRETEAPTSLQFLATAGERAMRSVPVARGDELAGELRSRLAGQRYDSAEDVAVLDGETLVGLVPIERLLAARDGDPVREIMDEDPPRIAPHANRRAAARKMVKRHECSLAVVGPQGDFRGLIPPYRMLAVLLDEHDEDLARVGGYLAGTRRARGAATEPVMQRLWHRLPWLLVGVIGAMASAVLVGAFEHDLDRNVLLAFFIPAVVYMADAIGTQTETVLIRAMAAGITVRSVVRRELLTGLVLGLVVGSAFLVFVLAGWDDARVAVAVAAALFGSCSIATLVAIVLPAAFQRLGKDPAFGSGPLATVVQDLLSIAVYFVIVSIVVL
jgi:magnesium transporter